jgi:hypothetical protein
MKLLELISTKRLRTSRSIIDFNFNPKRVRYVSKTGEIPNDSSALVYWMSREQRVQGLYIFF